jgi:hypothetical protein
MTDRNVYPLNLESFGRLIEAAGYERFETDEASHRVSLRIKGDEVTLHLDVILGVSPDGDPWYVRFLSYAVDFSPIGAGIPEPKLMGWLNAKNADVLFGRYYWDREYDTIAFEISVPGNGGIVGEDFQDILRIATASVDRTHGVLRELAKEPQETPAPEPE